MKPRCLGQADIFAMRPKIVISKNFDTSNTEAYVKLLAHESHHHKLHSDLIRLGGVPFSIWKHRWFEQELEAYCREFERKVAIELGLAKPKQHLSNYGISLMRKIENEALDLSRSKNEALDLSRSFKTTLPYAQNCIIKNFTAAIYKSPESFHQG